MKTKWQPQKEFYLRKKTDAFFEGQGFACDQFLHEQVEVVFINHRFFLPKFLDLVLPSEGLARKIYEEK